MSTIDHAGEAAKCEDSAIASRNSNDPDGGLMWAMLAQYHATLALAEQARIANLIALGLATTHQTVMGGNGRTTQKVKPNILAALKIGDPE